MTRTLTIVGASARAAAASARRADYTVYAADLFADVDLRSLCTATAVQDYPAGLAAVIRASQAGGWMYTGSLENHPDLVAAWSRQRQLFGNAASVLRRVRDPQLMTAALAAAGLPSARVTRDATTLAAGETWLRKPLAGGFGRTITRVQADNFTHDAGEAADHYFQQFIAGQNYSAVYVAAQGQAVLLGITRQLVGDDWTGAIPFQYAGSIGPLALSPDVIRPFAEIGAALAREFELAGLFGVDAIVNPQGVWAVECNPRYTASVEVLERALGIHAVELHVAACTSGQLPSPRALTSQTLHGKAIVYATAPLLISPHVPSFRDQSAISQDVTVADIPQPGSRIESGWPICTVLVSAADEPGVLRELQAAAAYIRLELEQATVAAKNDEKRRGHLATEFTEDTEKAKNGQPSKPL